MKMKQVMQETGLTERTIRFYLEKGLVEPEITRTGDRDYADFSPEDIWKLRCVSNLRHLGFTVAEILELQKDPSTIPRHLQRRLETLQAEQSACEQAQEVVGAMQGLCFPDFTAFGKKTDQLLFRSMFPIREINLGFGRLDGEDGDQMDSYEENNESMHRVFQKKRRKVVLMAGILAAVVLIVSGFGFWMHQNNRGMTYLCGLTDVVVTSKKAVYERDNKSLPNPYTFDVRLLDEKAIKFYGDKPITLYLDGQGQTSNIMYGAIFTQQKYAMVNLQIFIPNRDMKKLGIEGFKNDANRVMQMVLTNPEYCEKYVLVSGLQAQYYNEEL